MHVTILKPSKNAMQSGLGRTGEWVIEYDCTSIRRPEALMGWTESGDTTNQVRLRFRTKEEAQSFAERQGWAYTVLEPKKRRVKPRNFADNFKYISADLAEKS